MRKAACTIIVRYYIPWLCKWTAADPLEAKFAGMSPYNYAFNNPVMWNDLNGKAPEDGDTPKIFFTPAPLPADRSDNTNYNPGPNPSDYKKPTISSDF
ncbi:RHS repeat-associated core domain-containing protein [Edaphocola flava]|uniref:RHS repeat-associated core domain-containing protein n=1 Tax=Edaphocola flava TaxID=2499629 RepID=UPI00100AD036|nr:RHS repeat-associated core domain-containing protein [Edaphocola flava]